MRRLAVVSALFAALAVLTSTAAQAGTVEKVTGSITMVNPMQAASFEAFEPTSTSPAKGSITYTNFELAVDGTGRWVPSDAFEVGFGVDPDPAIVAVYHFTVDTVTPLSPTSVKFSGTGALDPALGPWHGPFEGKINGSTLSFTLLETNGPESYTLKATGTIDAAGAVSGTWSDNYGGGRTGTFGIADVGHEVFSYTAPVTCAVVNPNQHTATFGFTIPAGGYLGGTPVVVKVTDNGSSGAANDTWGHAQGDCDSPVSTTYPIVSGNLTVHG